MNLWERSEAALERCRCETCKGKGRIENGQIECPNCNGSGMKKEFEYKHLLLEVNNK